MKFCLRIIYRLLAAICSSLFVILVLMFICLILPDMPHEIKEYEKNQPSK